MHIFYTPDIQHEIYVLNETESKHVVRVLRLKTGDAVFLVDGRGGFYKARLLDDNAKRCTVQVVERKQEYGKRSFHLHIAIAPTKNIDRFEWFLEKSTEIGIDTITPVLCKHSERKRIKLDRSMRVITAAVKQSIKAYHPVINALTDFSSFVKQFSNQMQAKKYIAHCQTFKTLFLRDDYNKGENAIVMIGPEGDFTKQEIQEAIDAGFKSISLGNNRLRTETAGVVACHSICFLNEH